MDTNIEPQINSFAGGMNSDDDLSVVATNQYIEARNIKISSYRGGENRDNRQGSLMPIQGVKLAKQIVGENQKIVATGSIRDYGVIVAIDGSNLKIYSFKNAIGGDIHNQQFNQIQDYRIVVDAPLLPLDEGQSYPDVFNIQLNYESENNIKLYLADSIHPIMVFNINREDKGIIYTDLDKCLVYPKSVCNPPKFEDYIAGKLQYGMVSYSYQLYNKYGQHSDISVSCKQIPIGNYNFNNNERYLQTGGKQDAQSNCGIKLSITIPAGYDHFDKIKVYRIQYFQNGQMPIISVIYDSNTNAKEGESSQIFIQDVGNEALEQISVEEFNSAQGVRIIPNSLAVKDGYMFAANVKTYQTTIKDFDKWDARAFRFTKTGKCYLTNVNGGDQYSFKTTGIINPYILPPMNHDCYDSKYNDINKQVKLEDNAQVFDASGKYIGGTGVNISWRFIISPQVGDACEKQNNTRKIGTLYNYIKRKNVKQLHSYYITSNYSVQNASNGSNFDNGIKNNTYLLKSLRRNEIYRYGIVLYDKYGQASPAKWIADIRTPNISDPQFNTFTSNTKIGDNRYELVVRNLGVQFKVNNLPEGCVGYQIVRCARHEQDMATISQGVLSSPVSNAYSVEYDANGNNDEYQITKYHTYCPTGFLTTCKFIEGYNCPSQLSGDGKADGSQCMTNIDNDSLLQFVSKEVSYQPESFKQFIKDKKYYIQTPLYLFGARGDYKFNDDIYDSPENNMYGDLKSDITGNTDWKFIVPGISNCYIPTYNENSKYNISNIVSNFFGGDKVNVTGINANGIGVITDRCKFIPYLDSAFNVDMFYRVNPQAFKSNNSGSIGGYGNDRSYSYALIKDCILDFDRLYTKQQSVAISRTEKVGKYIVQKAFGYIKLYESSKTASSLLGESMTIFDVSKNNRIISDFKLAESISWDKVFKRNYNKDNEEQASSKQFINSTTSSGGKLFTNVITGGLCSDQAKNIIEKFDGANGGFSGDNTGTSGKEKRVCWGTGGRCLLLTCENTDDYITNVKGCTETQTLDSYDGQIYSTTEYAKYNGIVKPSMLGTYLCNFRQETTPYGGYSFINRLTNTYYGDGDYYDAKENGWIDVYNGDCNIELFEYTSMHKIYGAYTPKGKGDLKIPNTHMITYAIPTESNIWCKLQYGWQFSVNAKDNYASFIQEEPCEITEAYVQEDPQYVYNSVYNTQNTSRPQVIYDDLNPNDYNKTIDTRVYYSDLKQNDEVIDSWCKFRSSNFIDVNQQYGPITNIYTFKNQLAFCQEQSFGVLSVNERSVTTDNSGQDIILGTGGVLTRYDYYSNTYGMHKQQFCMIGTNGGLYWFDSHNNTICLFDGQSVVQLSKQGKVQNILNKYKKLNTFNVFYNGRYNEIIFNVLSNDMQLVYNEMIGKFTSIYTLPFDGSIQFFNGEYLVKNNDYIDIYQYDCLDNNPKSTTKELISSYIQYVVAQQPLITKVFDNQEIVTYENLQTDNTIYDEDDYFSKHHNYTWKTESQEIKSDLYQQITLRENNHRFSIPRADGLFGNRARGKVMLCSIEDTKPNPTVAVQYIITKYRQSWS